MPRTSLTVQEPTRTAQINAPTANAADFANGNRFINDGKTILIVANGSGGALTVTIPYGTTVDGLTVAPQTYSIPDGSTGAILGPWKSTYNQTLDSVPNSVAINWSTGTSVTVKVIRVTTV